MSYLIYNPDTSSPVTYELMRGVNTIGRSRDNTICITDMSLSRQHAVIEVQDNRVTVSDRNSSNHVFVNEAMIQNCQLKDGDVLRLGRVVLKFVASGVTSSQKSPRIERSPTAVVTQFSPRSDMIGMQDLLEPEERDRHSVLNLRSSDTHLRAVDKLKILLDVSQQLSSPESTNKLLDKILDLLFKIMGVDRAAILLVNNKTKAIEEKAVRYRSQVLEDEYFYSKSITNTVLETGNAILTSDAHVDERFQDCESIIYQGIHASVCVPLKPRDKVIGVLYVDNLSMSDVYSNEDVEFLSTLANQAAIAIDNAELRKKMQEEAVMRNKLEQFFAPAVSRKLREEGKLEIIEAEVTALFSDITRFTQMSSRLEPRQVISMLNEYFKVMVEDIVFPYQGTLEKYIGDALVAVWGAPYARKDDVERAVKAAINMQWAVRRMNDRWTKDYAEPLQIHIGLNTGLVAAGNIGSERLIQYAHIGDTMNVASRICSAAQAGEIMISASTFKQLGDHSFPLEKMPHIRVKGKDQALQLYRLHWEEVHTISL